MHVAVLMPAFDEGERLVATIADLSAARREPEEGVDFTVFVVDDGSEPPIDVASLRGADGVRVVLARHPVNLGQGAALETARRLALDDRFCPEAGPFDAFVTMDADGQHRAEDAIALAKTVRGGADVALGNRFAGDSNVPTGRRILLMLARVFERWVTGLRLADAHNGLRAFSLRAIRQIRLRQNRMAHATELTRTLSRAASLRIVEVPVSVRYSREALAKGQSTGGAVAIVVDLFQSFLFGE